MANNVTGEQYYTITGQLGEILRQIRQKNGYAFDPEGLIGGLQDYIEGKFVNRSDGEVVTTIQQKESPKPAFLGKTISAPAYKDKKAVEKVLTKKKIRIGKYADQLLGKLPYPLKKEEEYEIVEVLVSELGYTAPELYSKVVAEGVRQGLGKCPPRGGIEVVLKKAEKDDRNWAILAMDTITDSAGAPDVFNVHFDGGEFWLYADYIHPDRMLDPDARVLFARRK
ncbi:MAG: hypothetical protein Q8P11_00995 [bacterium]|nr:hypothetical protein [bacterium]